ncbi:protein PTST [Populus alba x Populus x berolinensis]|nr:protein PTST [Populus alba x Populus x berolinensis]
MYLFHILVMSTKYRSTLIFSFDGQALVTLSEEIAQYEIPEGSRKINGKYVQSHLLSRLRVSCGLSTCSTISFDAFCFTEAFPSFSSQKFNWRLCCCKVLQEKLKDQIKDVDAAKSKEVSLFWCGMAESVQVMGSFDGWSQGEHLSPEYDGSFTKFSATLMLRPGRYEIKFLVDGDWQLSPEYPTIGEGLTENNLLIVE